MSNPTLTTNIKHMLGALLAQGVRDFVVSPGSRTTPVALLVAELGHQNEDVTVTVDVDERSAGFFALGMAKRKRQAVVLLATSGTATANYLPAVVEASVSHVPLIVLTTDRPMELQGIGAPQTIDQTHLYGTHAKGFVGINLQDDHADVTAYIDYEVQQAVAKAVAAPSGVVQINLPLRKPLMPDLGEAWPIVSAQVIPHTMRVVEDATVADIAADLAEKPALILAGPAETDLDTQLLTEVATHYRMPILADVLSNVRPNAQAVNGIDVMIEAGVLTDDMVPGMVIRLGGTPVSAKVVAWLREHRVPVIQVGMNYAGHDHSRQAQATLAVDQNIFLAQLLTFDGKLDDTFAQRWQAAQSKLMDAVADDGFMTELSLPQALTTLPENGNLFIANSMPIRDMDNYFVPTKPVFTMANRGANGIDGTVSSAFGMAMSGRPTYLLTGDLTLFHDMNGLMMARQAQVDMTIIVVNNNGGGIFSFLPQAAAKDYFEPMFGTPLDLDVAKIADLYHATYHHVTTGKELAALVSQPANGLRLIEMTSDRSRNVAEHDVAIAKIKEAFHA